MIHKEANEQGKQKSVSRPAIIILGVGNILLRDEGVGVRVIEAMEGRELPDNVELLDGGTASMDLLTSLANRDKVIIIDAVKGGNEPGTLYRFSPDDITIQKQTVTSLHQVGLLETLTIARHLGCTPREVIIFGIEPKEVSWGLELSPEVASATPRVIELVLEELGIKEA
ncbi:MAG: HyaD/HybD family hydrogenase maturation endopeptidase [Chloroflexota bacterium]